MEVETIFFDCGQGDTILLRLQDKWLLIDCHLPPGAIRQRFFDLVSKLKIERLEVIFLTHPHHDHYHGMGAVVDYFTTGERSIGYFCDSGVTPAEMLQILKQKKRPQPYIAEYTQLLTRISKLIKAGRLQYFAANQDSMPVISHAGISLRPIGPRPELVREMTHSYLARTGEVPRLTEDLNLFSLILVLQAEGRPFSLRKLFTGDADGQGINRALAVLKERASGIDQPFDVVKIPHHGSGDSHKDSVLWHVNNRKDSALALVSVGNEYEVLPDREVLNDYLSNGWSVLLTTKRIPALPPTRTFALQLSGKNFSPVQNSSQDIRVTWSEKSGLAWKPKKARLSVGELHCYQTVLKGERGSLSE